jgi:nucleoside 2-deoxyribosyltransferase
MIYIAGPVTGYEDDNRPAFEEARRALKARGCLDVRIPHDFVPEGAAWSHAMRRCIKELTDADALVFLPGSCDSRGASLESAIARELGIPAFSLWEALRTPGRCHMTEGDQDAE